MLLPLSIYDIYDIGQQHYSGDAALREDSFQAMYVLGRHSSYSGVTDSSAFDLRQVYLLVGVEQSTMSTWNRFRHQAVSQGLISNAWQSHDVDQVWKFVKMREHEQKAKADAVRQEGKKAFQLRRFETAYHEVLHRICLIVHAGKGLDKLWRMALDLIGESEDITPLHAKFMKIQLDCASAFWHKHHAEVVDPCGKKDEDKANVSYTMYCEVRDRANALGLQDDHRWMLHLDFHISFIEIRYLKEFDKAKTRLERMIRATDGDILCEVQLIRIALLYSDCLAVLGQLDGANVWRKKSFNIYCRLMKWELYDQERASTLDVFTWDNVDKIFQYDALDPLDMEYGVVASE
ncbi:hypothetical protein DL546_007414 [Coniochaeta pulveracea]|nr:hypothetical protein DL546_007414 [Coniochaeta pulveracea]